MTLPLRRAGALAAVALALAAVWRPAAADDQAQADLQWGWVTLELGLVTTGRAAIAATGSAERVALIGGLGSVSAAIGAGVLAQQLGAPIAGANAVHGALFFGGELALVGALLDHDGRTPRFRRLARGLGALGLAGGGWIGATRIPTDAYSLAWTYAPVAGFLGGIVIAAGAELASPSSGPGRRAATIIAVTVGLGLGAGWLMAEHHVGIIAPEPSSAPAAARLFTLTGRF